MKLNGKALELLDRLRRQYPEALFPLSVPGQMLAYQYLALYGLAKQYDRPGAQVLEIGTAHGASSLMMALAAPQASITTLTVSMGEALEAEGHWRRHGVRNITVIVQKSTDYWTTAQARKWDLVFVDGDHNGIRRDMVWWNSLASGGLFVCHDYSPQASAHPCPPVYATLNDWGRQLKREFDVLVVDETQTGLAGWYRRAGEVWA